MKPTLNIFGIEETNANKNKFVPHYRVLANKLYDNTRLTLFNPRSVMNTRQAYETIDFWNCDSDFFYAEDALSFNELLNFSGNHGAYFQDFLKVMRIAHGHYGMDLLDTRWQKNKAHMLDIFASMLVSDVIMVSPVLRDTLMNIELPKLWSKNALKVVESKMLVLPPPDLYKFEPPKDIKKNFKTLTFLWNHRLNAAKNPKAFFGIIEDFHTRYPKVPIKIILLSSLTSDEIKKIVPKSLAAVTEQRPFAYDDAAYEQSLMDANVTIGTSTAESYGISILESARYGLAIFNLPCNEAYTKIIGDKTTLKAKEVPERLHRLVTEKGYADKVLKYTAQGLAKITNTEQYKKKLSARLVDVFGQRLERASTKSPKIALVMKALDKKALTKQEVYAVMGWSATGRQPVNTFWSDYYHGLRKLGVETTVVKGTLYYHTGVKPVKNQQPKTTTRKLFKGK
jgi:hypothetical protein